MSDEWIWNQFKRRIAAEGIELAPERILERGTFELHSYMTEHDAAVAVFLAGDAAISCHRPAGRGMNRPRGHRRTGRRASAGTLVRIPLVDADFDDDNGQVEVRFETEILGDISVGAVAFQVTILAAI